MATIYHLYHTWTLTMYGYKVHGKIWRYTDMVIWNFANSICSFHCISKFWYFFQNTTRGGGGGVESILRCHLTSIGNPIVEIRRSYDRLISTMVFPLPVRWHLEWKLLASLQHSNTEHGYLVDSCKLVEFHPVCTTLLVGWYTISNR